MTEEELCDKMSLRLDEYTARNIEKIRRHMSKEGLTTISKSAVVCASINRYAESLDEIEEVTDSDTVGRSYVVLRDDTRSVIVGTLLTGDSSQEALRDVFPRRTLLRVPVAEADVVIKPVHRTSDSMYSRSVGYRVY